MKSILNLILATALVPFGLVAAEEAPAAAPAADAAPRVKLDTNHGDIVLELNREKAPVSVENFLSYVRKGHYDGTLFHRVIDGFMIQGGGFTSNNGQLVQKATDAPIANEAKNGLKNDRGTIAMARTSNPDSATSQFFINVVDNDNLNHPSFDGHGYAVFGKVVEGMEVVDKIKSVKTGAKIMNGTPASDVPVEDVVIESAKVVE